MKVELFKTHIFKNFSFCKFLISSPILVIDVDPALFHCSRVLQDECVSDGRRKHSASGWRKFENECRRWADELVQTDCRHFETGHRERFERTAESIDQNYRQSSSTTSDVFSTASTLGLSITVDSLFLPPEWWRPTAKQLVQKCWRMQRRLAVKPTSLVHDRPGQINTHPLHSTRPLLQTHHHCKNKQKFT